MKNLNFILHIFRTFSIKTLFKISKEISSKQNKNRNIVIFDMILCGIKYKAAFHDYQEFEFYNLNKNQRKTYLTRGINNKIIKQYNDKKYWILFDDKHKFNKTFKNFIKRETIDLEQCNIKQFNEFLKDKDKIIAKPNKGEGGKGISIINLKNKNTKTLYTELIKNNTTLIEEVINQHNDLKKLYDKSVNSLRLFTFQENGNVHFLQGILKIGNGNIVDNFFSGGMYTFVNEKGIVITPAIDKNDNIYEHHPITNQKIVGFKVPYFKESIEMVKQASLVVPQIQYVGWDVAITNDGPIIIEGNCYPGVFQIKPSLSKTKKGILEIYKKIMKIK